MISRINVRLRWIRRRLNRTHWAARLLGYSLPKGETHEPGLILIQIDGLSRHHLERAIQQGKMPFIAGLIRREHFTLESFYSGVPSTTPAVQGEIFFGVRSAVPSFQFLDRKAGKIRRMYEAESAIDVENKLREKCPHPLLDGAHAYSDIYAAGAAESWYCSRDFRTKSFLRGINPVKWLILMVLYFVKVLRIAVLAVIEFGLAIVDVFKGLFEHEDFVRELLFVPARVLICSALREFIRFCVLLDVERGVRVIHANFLGYDEQAHRRGPQSAFAYWTLKGIDRAVRDIYRAAEGSSYRDYELIVYSDHGQEHATPYAKVNGRELDAAIAEVFSTGPMAEHPLWTPKVPTIIGNTLDRCRDLLGWKDITSNASASCDPAHQIVLTAMGPVGHVYLPRVITNEERLEYARELVHRAQVPLVLLPGQADEITAINRQGEWTLPRDAEEVLGAGHPFLKDVARDLVGLAHHPDAGEFLISGWDPAQKPVSFPKENGAHGGPGQEETHAFLLIPDRILRWHAGTLERHAPYFRGEELKKIALHYLGREGEREEVIGSHRVREDETLLRVATYNVHSCRGLDGKVRPERIARVINHLDPDVVAVQELDAHRLRTGGHDQAHMIAKHLRMEHAFYNVLADENEKYGIGIFSKYPFEVRRMSVLTEAAGLKEARAALWITFDRGEGRGRFHVINTHFGLGQTERGLQTDALMGSGWLHELGETEPVVLCGDFNSAPNSQVWRRLSRQLTDCQLALPGRRPRPTFPSARPLMRIDHIFVNQHFEVKQVVIPSTPTAIVASDHLPLCVELAFKNHEHAG